VGRGGEESWCFLISENEEAKERLEQFCETDDGFEIAELDLKLRGAGDLNGYLQSGMSPLRFVDYLNDIGFIQETIKKVSEILSK
jgi:ATP-dependent DNA helicase RecG